MCVEVRLLSCIEIIYSQISARDIIFCYLWSLIGVHNFVSSKQLLYISLNFFLIKNSDMVGQWQVVFFASCFNLWFCLQSIKTALHFTNGYHLFVATLSYVAMDDYFRHQL